jgi:hypothetical protein
MQEYNPPFLDQQTAVLRKRARTIGLVLIGFGVHLPNAIKMTELQSGLCRMVAALGVATVVCPMIRDYQDSREFLKSLGDDDTEDGDDWPGDGGWPDDPETPNMPPKGPSGIAMDWIKEVEDYANEKTPALIS